MKPKRAISLLLAGCMAVSMVPASAVTVFAETVSNSMVATYTVPDPDHFCGKTEEDSVYWSYDDSTKTLTISGDGAMKDYGSDDRPIWYDASNQDMENVVIDIENVVIEKGITSIGNSAFENCIYLNSATIPKGITSIGDSAFYNCNLQSIEIPNGVLSIGSYAFGVCPFTSVTIPDSVTSIGEYAFNENHLTSVIIPASVKTIGKGAFEDCSYLTDVQISSGVTSISESMFNGCGSMPGMISITIPSSIEEIQANAFNDIEQLKIYYTGDQESWNILKNKAGSGNDILKNLTPVFTHYVTFKDGSNIIKTTLTDDNGKVSAPVDLSKEGYTFVGWSKSETGTELFDFDNDSVEADTIFYAVWKRVPATLDMTAAQGKHKVNEPVEVTVDVTPNDYKSEIFTGKVALTYDNDVKSVAVNGNELIKKEYSIQELYQNFQQNGLGMNAKLTVTYNKSGSHDFKVELKDKDDKVLCGDTVTIEIDKKEDTKPENPVATYALTVKGGTVKVNDKDAVVNDGVIAVEKDATVEVTFDKSTLSDAQVFDQWTITPDSVLNAVDPKAETITFKMPAEKVTIEAMTKDATIEDDGPDILGTAAMIGVGVAGTAVLGYQGYMIGTELYLNTVLPDGVAIPQNTTELAKLVWTDAGKPEPIAPLAADATDEQKALTWAIENQLISADKAADASVTRWEVIQTWNKAQEMKG